MATLYRFFDSEDTLLYIGITEAPLTRLDGHAAVQPWWHLVARASYEHFPTRAQARNAEIAAIQSEHPAFNVADNGERKLSARLIEWEAKQQRRAIATFRAIHGEADYRLPPYETVCPLPICGALEFEPCRTSRGVLKDKPHGARDNVSWKARHCVTCGGPPRDS